VARVTTRRCAFDLIVTFSAALRIGLGPDADEDQRLRLRAVYDAVFQLGPAWHGSQRAVFLRSDLDIDEVMARLAPVTGQDTLVVMETGYPRRVRYSGLLADMEGFRDLFPDAVEVCPDP
jgi:hypothetical protein